MHRVPFATTQTQALTTVIGLTIEFRAVREVFNIIGAPVSLRFIARRARDRGYSDSEVCAIKDLAKTAILCLQNNEVYTICKVANLEVGRLDVVDGHDLRSQVEVYLKYVMPLI